MKRVYSSLNSMLVDNMANALEQEGIPCEVRNRNARSAIGELPISSVYVELWVDDEHAEAASRQIEAAIHSDEETSQGESWTCSQCGESIDGSLAECWRCASAGSEDTSDDEAEPIFDAVRSLLGRYQIQILAALGALACMWWLS